MVLDTIAAKVLAHEVAHLLGVDHDGVKPSYRKGSHQGSSHHTGLMESFILPDNTVIVPDDTFILPADTFILPDDTIILPDDTFI